MWVEQSSKQPKYALGWSAYQVRSDVAIRRHWALVCCAFAFWWSPQSQQSPAPVLGPAAHHRACAPEVPTSVPPPASRMEAGRGENQQSDAAAAAPAVLAGG